MSVSVDAEAGAMHISGAGPAIFWGGLAVGVLDLAYAVVFYSSYYSVRATAIPQSIASGLLGADAFKGGMTTVALGTALHFFIAYSVAAVYVLASRRLRFLTKQAVLWGMIYGAAVYTFMHTVVLPLSAVAKGHHNLFPMVCEFIEHCFFVGLPVALIAKRYEA